MKSRLGKKGRRKTDRIDWRGEGQGGCESERIRKQEDKCEVLHMETRTLEWSRPLCQSTYHPLYRTVKGGKKHLYLDGRVNFSLGSVQNVKEFLQDIQHAWASADNPSSVPRCSV
jgi:hypothetical protein